MTIDEANRVFRYWERHPPTFALMAGFTGFKPKERAAEFEGVSYEEAAAPTAEWFKDSSRFFH